MVRRGWNAGKSPPPGVTIKRMFRKRKIIGGGKMFVEP